MNRRLVLKFGGTSVADADAIGRLIRIVRTEVDGGGQPVVVVSAMSGVTDRLFAMAAAAVRGERADVMQQLDDLRTRHEDAARALMPESGRHAVIEALACLLYTSPSPRDRQKSRMPSSA